jgi:hypothetical protein
MEKGKDAGTGQRVSERISRKLSEPSPPKAKSNDTLSPGIYKMLQIISVRRLVT